MSDASTKPRNHTVDQPGGVMIGMLLGFQDDSPLVVFPGNDRDHAIPARTLTALTKADIGAEVALLFEEGRRDAPLIVGRILDPARQDVARIDPGQGGDDTVKLTSTTKMELRCGKASIVMAADGTVTIKGTQILTRAERQNRVQGASVLLN